MTLFKMWLNLSWDEPIDKKFGILFQGRFNLSSCGGPSDWSITTTKFDKAYFSCPYNGEKFGIVFSFYGNIVRTPLHELSLTLTGKRWEDDK